MKSIFTATIISAETWKGADGATHLGVVVEPWSGISGVHDFSFPVLPESKIGAREDLKGKTINIRIGDAERPE